MIPSDVRRCFVTRIAALPGWRESPFAPPVWSADPIVVAHQSFTVALGDEVVTGGRGTKPSPYLCTIEVQVPFLFKMRPNQGNAESRTDYDLAWDAADSLIRWTLELDEVEGISVTYSRTPRPVVLAPDGNYLQLVPTFLVRYYRS